MKCGTVLVLALPAILAMAGKATAQCQTQELLPVDLAQDDRFGTSVSIDGDWAIVGEPSDEEIQSVSGAAYLYQRVGSSWAQVQKLKASPVQAGAYFGVSVAISGDVIVVGAPHDNGQGVFDCGAAYVFERTGSVWNQTAQLVAADAVQQMEFGQSVAASGTRVLVGVPQEAHADSLSGAAYVLDRVGTAWVQTAKLVASDAAFADEFGYSVSISGDEAVIGALAKDGPGGNSQGAAYVFENQVTGWVQTQELLAADGIAGNYYGRTVCVSGDTMLIAAPNRSQMGSSSGVIYAYTHDNTGWVLMQEFWPDDSHVLQELGTSLSISGTVALIGAGGDNDAGGMTSGSAYTYFLQGSTWVQAGKLMATNAAQADVFGNAVGLSGDTALIGAPQADNACPSFITCNSGAAYIFQIATTALQYGHCPTGAPCNNIDKHGGCRNSTGQGAILAAGGSGSVTTNDLQLELTHCPANKLTLLFMGGGQVQVPFGDGKRVVSGGGMGVFRFGIATADANGISIRGPGIAGITQGFHNPAGHIQQGQTWNFQTWYRDLTGPCGGLTNYSNGVQVSFGL